MDAETEPPPRQALRCPTGLAHSRIAVRENWFYCRQCDRVDAIKSDGRHPGVINKRSDELLEHEEFVERWGVGVYGYED